MKGFEENSCRICSKTLCCKDCRARHEENEHKVNSECDICIYGKATIKNFSSSLLSHIRSNHWPLHCVVCQIMFNTLDDLIQHSKCVANAKVPKCTNAGTPPTPVTPVAESLDRLDPSVLITPFYKNIVPGNHKIGLTLTMGVTSTPMQKSDFDTNKTTPITSGEIKYIYKSSLKLTASGTLNESKKSDRRVTFSETPTIEHIKKTKQDHPYPNDTANSSSSLSLSESDDKSINDVFVTPSSSSSSAKSMAEKENNRICEFSSDSVSSMWESALTNVDLNTSILKTPEMPSNRYCVASQVSIFNEKTTISKFDASLDNSSSLGEKSMGIWSSMTNMVKSVMQNISVTAQNNLSSSSFKRPNPDTDIEEVPSYKRMRLTDLKCRRPIRHLSHTDEIRLFVPKYVDKATQTDDFTM